MPELSTAVVLEMLRVAGEAPVDAVALQDGDRFRPLPCLVRVRSPRRMPHMRCCTRGSVRCAPCSHALRIAVIDEATWTALDPGRGSLRDVDEPGDLEPSRRRRATGRVVPMAHEPRSGSGPSRSSRSARAGRRSRSPTRSPGHAVDWPAERARHPWAFARRGALAVARARVPRADPGGRRARGHGRRHRSARTPRGRSTTPNAWHGGRPRARFATSSSRTCTPIMREGRCSTTARRGSRTPGTTRIRPTGSTSARTRTRRRDGVRRTDRPERLEADGTLSLEPDDHEVSPGVRVISHAGPHAGTSQRGARRRGTSRCS